MVNYVCGDRFKIIKNGINTLKLNYKNKGKKYVKDESDSLLEQIYNKFGLGRNVFPKDNTRYSEARMNRRNSWGKFITCVRTGEDYKFYKINGGKPVGYEKENLQKAGLWPL